LGPGPEFFIRADGKVTTRIASGCGPNFSFGGRETRAYCAYPQAARRSPQDVGEKREVSPDAVLTTLPATKQDARPKTASPPFRHAKLTTNEESTPTTIKGWTLHDIADGVAILEGPNGIRRVKRGDLVPGVGRIESIVRWGKRWIVVTSSGLISTP
jgi:hypothetical protein